MLTQSKQFVFVLLASATPTLWAQHDFAPVAAEGSGQVLNLNESANPEAEAMFPIAQPQQEAAKKSDDPNAKLFQAIRNKFRDGQMVGDDRDVYEFSYKGQTYYYHSRDGKIWTEELNDRVLPSQLGLKGFDPPAPAVANGAPNGSTPSAAKAAPTPTGAAPSSTTAAAAANPAPAAPVAAAPASAAAPTQTTPAATPAAQPVAQAAPAATSPSSTPAATPAAAAPTPSNYQQTLQQMYSEFRSACSASSCSMRSVAQFQNSYNQTAAALRASNGQGDPRTQAALENTAKAVADLRNVVNERSTQQLDSMQRTVNTLQYMVNQSNAQIRADGGTGSTLGAHAATPASATPAPNAVPVASNTPAAAPK